LQEVVLVAHIRAYPLNAEHTALRYQAERPDGTPIEGCVETAMSSSDESRMFALQAVLDSAVERGYEMIEIPTAPEPYKEVDGYE
jgi:hypothetical protein